QGFRRKTPVANFFPATFLTEVIFRLDMAAPEFGITEPDSFHCCDAIINGSITKTVSLRADGDTIDDGVNTGCAHYGSRGQSAKREFSTGDHQRDFSASRCFAISRAMASPWNRPFSIKISLVWTPATMTPARYSPG